MRILIADDHELLRDVLRSYLEAEGGFAVDTVADLPAALVNIAEAAPPYDLVVLGYDERFLRRKRLVAEAGGAFLVLVFFGFGFLAPDRAPPGDDEDLAGRAEIMRADHGRAHGFLELGLRVAVEHYATARLDVEFFVLHHRRAPHPRPAGRCAGLSGLECLEFAALALEGRGRAALKVFDEGQRVRAHGRAHQAQRR